MNPIRAFIKRLFLVLLNSKKPTGIIRDRLHQNDKRKPSSIHLSNNSFASKKDFYLIYSTSQKFQLHCGVFSLALSQEKGKRKFLIYFHYENALPNF